MLGLVRQAIIGAMARPGFVTLENSETKTGWTALQFQRCQPPHLRATRLESKKEALCKPRSSIAAVFSASPLSPAEASSLHSISIPSLNFLLKRHSPRPRDASAERPP